MRFTNKGYTLLEVLLTVLLVAMMSVLAISFFEKPEFDHYFFMNDFLRAQSRSLAFHQREDLNEGLHFTADGHINLGKTLNYGKHNVIVHIGNGFLTYE